MHEYNCFSFDCKTESGQNVNMTFCGDPKLNPGWHHVAIIRIGSFLGLTVDGELKANTQITEAIANNTGDLVVEGPVGGGIDELRISDIARYNENFVPSTVPFSCDEHTLALWHFDEAEGATEFHDSCGIDNVLFRVITSDFDSDGDVDGRDLAVFAAAFGSSTGDPNFNSACDLHEDGVIEEQDLHIFAGEFGR